jgi:hypothetical protein
VSPAISPHGKAQTLYFPDPVRLNAVVGGARRLHLTVKLAFAIVESDRKSAGQRVNIQMYQYSILDYWHKELLVYHWQPDVVGPDFPHIHVSAALNAQIGALEQEQIALDKLHLPTGFVTLQSVIRMLITEFDIRPLRADWQTRLDVSQPH